MFRLSTIKPGTDSTFCDECEQLVLVKDVVVFEGCDGEFPVCKSCLQSALSMLDK